MKQQSISPAVAAGLIVLVLLILAVVGWKVLGHSDAAPLTEGKSASSENGYHAGGNGGGPAPPGGGPGGSGGGYGGSGGPGGGSGGYPGSGGPGGGSGGH
jgi:hypothetical protein